MLLFDKQIMKLSYKRMIIVCLLLENRHVRALSTIENQVKEKRGQNTISCYPNEMYDLLSQNNIPADLASRNSNTETDSERRSILGEETQC